MNSQNRMNAGAEYVLYRIWATLQDEKGIHAGSLLTCVGALAGFACQTYARQTVSSPEVAPGGNPLTGPLFDSPLSIWALVGLAVRKLGKPLPDLQDILRHAAQLPDEHRPHHSAAFYLKHLWPQVHPIAQRFCRRPMQMPVLFGIALQRAIEHTSPMLSPTLGARIAMSSAVAAARMARAEARANAAPVSPMPVASRNDGAPAARLPVGVPRAGDLTARLRANALRASALIARTPPAARVAMVATLAFAMTAGMMLETDRNQLPQGAGLAQVGQIAQVGREFADSRSLERTIALAEATSDSSRQTSTARYTLFTGVPPDPSTERNAPAVEQPPVQEARNPPAPASDSLTADEIINEYMKTLRPQEYDGSNEGVMRDDYGQPLT